MKSVFSSAQEAEDYRQAHGLHGRAVEPLGGNRWGLVFPVAGHLEVRDGAPAGSRATAASEPGTPEDDARRAVLNRQRAQRDAGQPLRWLSCSCCGARVRGRQWHNRDTGYGVCMPCTRWMIGRGTSADELANNYGAEGIHYGDDLATD